MRNVLVANRGEIAVRVIRACRDAGLGSVAVYADADRDAPHVRLADQAYALGGQTAADTYLRVDKLLDVARRAGADAVHPGYGFLSENAEFAAAVLAADLTWIGPSPEAIRALGDKITARELARRAGAPLVPGTTAPAAGPEEAVAFAAEYGLPIAIKAAYGGGGRGLKVARTMAEIPALFESATREAVAAFGRGECFLERYLDRPRHVEAQILADQHGNVVVAGTRDCSLQRRHQKLVEEAPAPFLTDTQRELIVTSAKAICREAGYAGAGTVEYLVGADGTVSFLEVNTRLQVEHPVTEETAGIDLVREQFRIAEGEKLRFDDDPVPRGHAIEFRINGEDPARGFLPAPGTIQRLRLPTGPGVRVDSGVETGSVVGGNFDSLLLKLIVTGETRAQALDRARRALDEMAVDGLATVLPFHRAVVRDDAFTAEPFHVHTRWIETEWNATAHSSGSPSDTSAGTGVGAGAGVRAGGGVSVGAGGGGADADSGEEPRATVVVEVAGKRLEVSLPASFVPGTSSAAPSAPGAPSGTTSSRRAGAASRASVRGARSGGGRSTGSDGPASSDATALTSPMQGTIVKITVADGDGVEEGDPVVVLEAMKMEQPLLAHRSGVVTGLTATVGEVVTAGSVICTIGDGPAG